MKLQDVYDHSDRTYKKIDSFYKQYNKTSPRQLCSHSSCRMFDLSKQRREFSMLWLEIGYILTEAANRFKTVSQWQWVM